MIGTRTRKRTGLQFKNVMVLDRKRTVPQLPVPQTLFDLVPSPTPGERDAKDHLTEDGHCLPSSALLNLGLLGQSLLDSAPEGQGLGKLAQLLPARARNDQMKTTILAKTKIMK